MSEEINKSKSDKIFGFLGIHDLIENTGKEVSLVVGCAMIVNYMLSWYVESSATIIQQSPKLFPILFMFAVMSVPMTLSVYNIEKWFNKDE